MHKVFLDKARREKEREDEELRAKQSRIAEEQAKLAKLATDQQERTILFLKSVQH